MTTLHICEKPLLLPRQKIGVISFWVLVLLFWNFITNAHQETLMRSQLNTTGYSKHECTIWTNEKCTMSIVYTLYIIAILCNVDGVEERPEKSFHIKIRKMHYYFQTDNLKKYRFFLAATSFSMWYRMWITGNWRMIPKIDTEKVSKVISCPCFLFFLSCF